MRRVICLLLVLMLCVAVPFAAFATETGDETESVVETEAPAESGEAEGEETTEPASSPEQSAPSVPTGPVEPTSPDGPAQTGDASGIYIWGAVMLLSMVAIAAMTVQMRKSQKN